jgi:histidinol-phosphate/aromatic aminotransferase/cobyric acid decarboxylase-like protein/choline kinase
MKAVILAAGIGKRLKPLTDNLPKCLVEVKGKPLLLHQLDALIECGIRKIIIVVGYKKELVQKRIGSAYRGAPVEYVVNNEYATTNNIYSLWLAKNHLDDDILLMECDVIFEKEAILRLLELNKEAVTLVDRFQLGMDGTVVEVGQDGLVSRLVTRNEQNERFDFSEVYKTINVFKLSQTFLANVFVPSLELYIRSKGTSSYYELVLSALVYLRSPIITALSARDLKWWEIDDQNDLEKAEYIFSSNEEKLQLVKKTYGAYWRYDFTDFCYLGNSYFPPPSMIAEMRYKLGTLISNYPSGQEDLDERVSRLFGIHSENVVAGNGSCQLIQILAENVLKGRMAMPMPTFGEYERTIPRDQVVPYNTEQDQFQLNLEKYGKLAREARNALLINPDNPTGSASRKQDLIAFLDFLQDRVQLLILDESFTDFIDGAGQNTLLSQQTLEKYPFVIVVRSLSKEFGVAGLRLGILASGDQRLIKGVREKLPIWSINSPAQLFIEYLLKYREEYALSCEKVMQSRNALFEGLKETFLKPYPSFADFVFCQVTGGRTASYVRDRLFLHHNILIKEFSHKTGLANDKYVRIASRTLSENRACLDAILSLREQ